MLKFYQDFETKDIHLEKSYNAENCNRGPFGLFENPVCCKISKKIKEELFETQKFYKEVSQSRKKMKRLPSRPVLQMHEKVYG